MEAMAQLGGIMMLDPEAPAKEQFFFGGIEKCRFKKPVVPGDTLVRPPLLFPCFSISSSVRTPETITTPRNRGWQRWLSW